MILPLIRSAIAAGLAVMILYVISDSGAVSLFRYQTLTYAAYQQMTGRYDHTAASILSLLLVLTCLASRRPLRLNIACLQTAYAGYALPGPVVALTVLGLLTTFAPVLYGSVVALLIAYILHFLPVGLQAMEPSLQQVTPNVKEAARTLGDTARQTLRCVTLPLIKSGFIAAWALVFLQPMKELPATLPLRPVGFDTLAIWSGLKPARNITNSQHHSPC